MRGLCVWLSVGFLIVHMAHVASAQAPAGPGGGPGPGGSGPGGSGVGPEGGPGAGPGAGKGLLDGACLAPKRGKSSDGGSMAGVPAAGASGSARACAPVVRGSSGRTGAAIGACGSSTGGRTRDSWQTWWDRNQARYVWERPAGVGSGPTTRAGADALVSLGRRSASDRPARSEIYTQIVPSLLQLLGDDDTEVVDAAARALGETVEAPFGSALVDALVPLLQHPEAGVQTAATLALGLLGARDAAPLLLELARCSSTGHRLAGGTSEVPRQLRHAATLALGYADDPASVAPLIDLVESLPESESEARQCAVHALGIMRNAETTVAASYLGARLEDVRLDPRVRAAIPTALARLEHVAAIDGLLEIATDRDTDHGVRQSAVIALGRLATASEQAVLDGLQRLVEKSKDAPTRHFAIMSLGQIGARTPDAPDTSGPHAHLEQFLVRAIDDPGHSTDRPWAALAAGVYAHGHPASRARLAVPLLKQYLDLKDPESRGAFALALGLGHARQAAAQLRADLEHNADDALASHLALALGLMGDGASAAELHGMFNRRGGGSELIYAAGLACRLIGDERATPLVAGILDGAASLEARLGLSAALGALGQRGALQTLHATALDGDLDPLSRAGACLALGRVTGVRNAPWQASLLVDSNYMLDEASPLEQILGRL